MISFNIVAAIIYFYGNSLNIEDRNSTKKRYLISSTSDLINIRVFEGNIPFMVISSRKVERHLNTYMLNVKRIRVSRSLTKILFKWPINACSVMHPSLLRSKTFSSRSLIIPGTLQYYMKVTLSTFFSLMAAGDRDRSDRSRYTSFK